MRIQSHGTFQTAATPAPRAAATPREIASAPVDEAVIGSTTDASPGRPPNEQGRSTTDALLDQMRPFIHEVRVAAAGQPPILAGTHPGGPFVAPEGVTPLPAVRWRMTPSIEAAQRAHYGSQTNEELRAQDRDELEPLIAPLLERRYGHQQGMAVAELGPATSTVVARTLEGRASQYFALDQSMPGLERNRDLLNEDGYFVAGAVQVNGDSYASPFKDGCLDLVFTSCHPPFYSGGPAERMEAFHEVARVLKPGGEFVLFPWEKQRHDDPQVMAFVNQRFEVVERAGDEGRQVWVFRKR